MAKVAHLRSTWAHAANRCFVIRSFSFAQPEPILNAERLRDTLHDLAHSMASSLSTKGYWTNTDKQLLVSPEEVRAMRSQCIALRNEGRFEQSWSESIDAQTGKATRFDKDGVYACEPDGSDYETAPDLLVYMSTLIGLLPPLMNDAVNAAANAEPPSPPHVPLSLSNQSFNAKLAVTSPGGSVYPLHVDNSLGITGSDTRKLTCILYLNPDYAKGDGGELRLVLDENETLDLDPRGGRLVVFWSDEIPHEVLPCAPGKSTEDSNYDRYALTVWIPDMDPRNIQPVGSKFESLRLDAFAVK